MIASSLQRYVFNLRMILRIDLTISSPVKLPYILSPFSTSFALIPALICCCSSHSASPKPLLLTAIHCPYRPNSRSYSQHPSKYTCIWYSILNLACQRPLAYAEAVSVFVGSYELPLIYYVSVAAATNTEHIVLPGNKHLIDTISRL
jgi:hypothetical protein